MSVSSERFNAMFELSPIAQEYYDERGQFVAANRAAVTLFGIENTQDLVEVNLFDNPHISSQGRAQLSRGEVFEVDMEYHFDRVKFRTSKSGTLYLKGALFPIPGPGPAPSGYLLQTIDVTERYFALEAMKASEERYRTLLENMDVGWLLIDENLVAVECRPTRGGLTDLDPAQVVGKHIESIHSFDDELRSRFESMVNHVLQSGAPIRWQAIPLRVGEPDNGKTRYMDVCAFRISLADRSHVACIITDVTEREQLGEQLLQAQKMESIGRLTSGITHDFNNLLASILGNAGLIEMDPRDIEEVKKSASEIRRAAEKASDLTGRMSSFSRKGKPTREPVDISAMVESTAAIIERTAHPDIHIELNLYDRLPTIMADRSRIESSIMNLFVNAIDAMPTGGTLTVSTRVINIHSWKPGSNPVVGPGRWVGLTVSDTGTGMDEQTRKRVFEPFFTTKDAGKGTGLGLYSVYGTVQAHDGHIALRSEPGSGTTFDIYLPLKAD